MRDVKLHVFTAHKQHNEGELTTMANAVLNLSELNGSNGFVINGIDESDRSGYSVSSAGDINGDGIDDLIIGAYRADPNGQRDAGESYVVFGSNSDFEASFNLSSLNGSNGFVINGIDAFDRSGISVSNAGDINSDGFDDLIIGASPDFNSQNRTGSSYVVFGSNSGFEASFNLSSLNGSNGFVINGIDADKGSSVFVSTTGDINGDGFDDLIIGATNACYVVFGSNSGFGASFNVSSLNGSNGFVINTDFSSSSVSSAGDINGDGFDDLIIGASNASPNGQDSAGESYVVFGSNSGFDAQFNLSSLNGSNGFVINGIDVFDRSGRSVSSAGDINGDGFDDLIIGASNASPNGQINAGESYVVFGSNSGFGASFNLSSLNGSNGFAINGIGANDGSGVSVSSAGDINGDGFDDLIIGTNSIDYGSQFQAGRSYVVFGRSSGFGAGFNLSSLDGSEGFAINGINSGERSGSSVSSAGDINGDGFDDLIIGAKFASPNGQSFAGESYVVFGFASPTPINKPPVAVNDTATTDEGTAINIEVLANDSNFLTLSAIDGKTVVVGTAITLSSGALVTLNADGSLTYDPNASFEVLAIGESGTDSFTYTTNNGSLTNTASVNLTINGVNDAPQVTSVFNPSSFNGSNGFVINGIDSGDNSGNSVSSAGDINGDGINDLIIGAPGADPNGQYNLYGAGESYVVFGSNNGFGASFNLSSLNGSNGFVINAIDVGDFLGISVSSAGDINGDGFDDLIIGAEGADPNGRYSAGESYVVFGSNNGFGASFNLSSLNGSNGFAIIGIDSFDESGNSVSSAGDINGDGFDDLIIGAEGADPNGRYSAGESYVVFGSNSDFGASFNLSSLNGSNGFAINGIDSGNSSGGSVSSAGDINGDGFDDLIIGAKGADPNGQRNAGESYVVFGSNSGFEASLNLLSLNGSNGFTINGIDVYDYSGNSVSSAGDINGDGIDDLIIGASNADRNGQYSGGESYVVFGRNSGFGSDLNLSSLNGSNGFVINGIDSGDYSGSSVSSAGDINGDGFDDLIIGAFRADPNSQSDAGESYVVFGSNSGFGASFNLSSLNGSNGFVINGIDLDDNSGRSVSSAGDINNDGFDDLIIGASGVDNAGSSYVVFGFQTAATTNEDTTVNILASNIIRRYTDIDGDTLTISDFTNPTNGTLTLNDNNTPDNPSDDFFIYTPNANFNGTDSFTFTVADGNGGTITNTFNLNVKPVNDAPLAVNDNLTTAFNTPLSIPASNLLANDTDTDSSNLSITGVSGATNGTAVLNDNGTQDNSADDFIVFTPTTGFSGNANFNYTISDGSLTSTAGVAIAIGGNIIGNNGNDNISAGDGNDNISGNRGNDTIAGNGGNDNISGGNGNDLLLGSNGNDTIAGDRGNDNISGGNGNDTFVFRLGDGNDIITDFAGTGIGSNPSAAVISQLDTLQFIGSGLTARNLQLTQNGNNLELSFGDAASTKATLQNFQLENLENLPANGSRPAIGNTLFDGQTSVTDSFDVFNANSTQTNLFNKNTVTFLNELNNNVAGFDNSNDVINAQGGNDIINGNSGDDLLRGGAGDDILIGGQGNDTLVGGRGNDVLIGGVGADKFLYNTNAEFTATAVGIDTITDFNGSKGDKIVLDKTTFGAIASVAGTGLSNTNDFQVTNLAGASTAIIVYNPLSGQLFYNQNGSTPGFGSGGLFATLTGAPTLTASDFVLQA